MSTVNLKMDLDKFVIKVANNLLKVQFMSSVTTAPGTPLEFVKANWEDMNNQDSKKNTSPNINARVAQGSWAREKIEYNRGGNIESSETIVFPEDPHWNERPVSDQQKNNTGPGKPLFVPRFGKKTLPCAQSSTFCEDVENYPGEYLDNVLQASENLAFRVLFKTDETDEGIQNRIDSNDATPLCNSKEETVFPKTAKNKQDVWLFVVNHGKFTQGVRIEKCVDQGKSCEYTDGFPVGYSTVCQQKHIYRTLVALNEKGETVTDTFQLPSCCACMVKKAGILSRHGSTQNTTKNTTPAR